MRKVNVLEFVSLDGVIQAPGGPEEDTSAGFAYGGWTSDTWASFWPQHNDMCPAVQHNDQVRRLEYHDFSRMAAVRVSKRRYCGKNHQN
jgi:hypothetical protein